MVVGILRVDMGVATSPYMAILTFWKPLVDISKNVFVNRSCLYHLV